MMRSVHLGTPNHREMSKTKISGAHWLKRNAVRQCCITDFKLDFTLKKN